MGKKGKRAQKRYRPKKWKLCGHCKKWIPEDFINYHENVSCRVLKGLDPAPEPDESDLAPLPTYTVRRGESAEELLARMRR